MDLKEHKIIKFDVSMTDFENVVLNRAEELKKAFDARTDGEVKEKHNSLVDALDQLNIDGRVKSADVKSIRVNTDGVLEVSYDGVRYVATGSSGHIVLDGEGVEMPQRSRLQFKNVKLSDDGEQTVVEAIEGKQGPQGKQGIQGPQGIPGIGTVGPRGFPGKDGEKGEKGEDGTSFQVLGLYPSIQALVQAHPMGQIGNAYGVGTEEANVVYVWDIDARAWVNLGSLQGPRGFTGLQGKQGEQGETGRKGDTGGQGIQGVQGIDGPKGKQGEPGVLQSVNGKTGAHITLGPADVGAYGYEDADGRFLGKTARAATATLATTAQNIDGGTY